MDKTKIAVKIFDNCAQQYQDKFMGLELYHDSLDLFCASIEKENAAVLDIACGPGNISKYLLEKRPGFKILGIDLSAKMIELARLNNPAAEFQVLDCRVIGQLGQKYDAAVCGFGLSYLSKEEALKLMREVAGLRRSGGVFYLSTMEDDYRKSGFKGSSSGGEEKMYIHYHQADYLTEALRENGFEIMDLQRKAYPEPDGASTTDLLVVAKKTDERATVIASTPPS